MILNSHLPVKAWLDPRTARLPGVQPVDVADWLTRSDSYDAQMEYRRKLMMTQRDKVYVATDSTQAACVTS